jgi:hypothetical protein
MLLARGDWRIADSAPHPSAGRNIDEPDPHASDTAHLDAAASLIRHAPYQLMIVTLKLLQLRVQEERARDGTTHLAYNLLSIIEPHHRYRGNTIADFIINNNVRITYIDYAI